MDSNISDQRIPKHSEAILFFNSLIIDLKLIQTGHEPTEPITMERLKEASRHVRDLSTCQGVRWPGIPDPNW